MKKKLAITLTAIMAFSAVPVYAGVPAAPTASKVTVNGEAKNFEAYNINDNNYFKLRDIAYVLNDTTASFAVGWDNEQNIISLDRYGKYKPTGNEMKISGTKDIKDAVENTSMILIDGEEVALKAYTIKGNNYFKLRDLAAAIGSSADWDNTTKTVAITTIAEENTASANELTELGVLREITGIWSEYGVMTEGFILTEDCPFTEIEVFYAEICGETATVAKFPGEYVAERSGLELANEYDFFFQYTFPEKTLFLNSDPEHPDYGKENPVHIEYEMATADSGLCQYVAEYNLLYEGNGGMWIE